MKMNRLKNVIRGITLMGGIALLFTACYPGDDIEVSELDIAFTHYDDTYNFADFKTFTLPDTVAHVVDEDVDVDHTYDQTILTSIRQNMIACGYEEKDSLGDVIMLATVFETENYSVYYYPWGNYWGWYPWGGYYKNSELKATDYYYYPYPSYGWGYPSVQYNYTTGTLTMQMTYPAEAEFQDDTVEVPVVWMGGINGVTDKGTTAQIKERINTNIDQCFEQSPYLKDGKN